MLDRSDAEVPKLYFSKRGIMHMVGLGVIDAARVDFEPQKLYLFSLTIAYLNDRLISYSNSLSTSSPYRSPLLSHS